MSFSIGTVACRFSATPVSLGQRSRQCVGRNLKSAKHAVLVLPQASRRIPFGVVPWLLLHSVYNITLRIRPVTPATQLWEFASLDLTQIFGFYMGLEHWGGTPGGGL